MRRREFISLLGGAVAARPLAAQAQQPDQMRRIGVLMNRRADNPEGHDQVTAFQQALQKLGWSDGRNGSTFVGARMMLTASASARRNW